MPVRELQNRVHARVSNGFLISARWLGGWSCEILPDVHQRFHLGRLLPCKPARKLNENTPFV